MKTFDEFLEEVKEDPKVGVTKKFFERVVEPIAKKAGLTKKSKKAFST